MVLLFSEQDFITEAELHLVRVEHSSSAIVVAAGEHGTDDHLFGLAFLELFADIWVKFTIERHSENIALDVKERMDKG